MKALQKKWDEALGPGPASSFPRLFPGLTSFFSFCRDLSKIGFIFTRVTHKKSWVTCSVFPHVFSSLLFLDSSTLSCRRRFGLVTLMLCCFSQFYYFTLRPFQVLPSCSTFQGVLFAEEQQQNSITQTWLATLQGRPVQNIQYSHIWIGYNNRILKVCQHYLCPFLYNAESMVSTFFFKLLGPCCHPSEVQETKVMSTYPPSL